MGDGERRLQDQLSFGEDVFGGPRWRGLVGAEQADAYAASGTIPVLVDGWGQFVDQDLLPWTGELRHT